MFSVENSVVKSLAQNSVRVLAMKLQWPLLPVVYIKRPALMSKFDRLMSSACTIVMEAAPGYGKSLAVAEWLHVRAQAREAVAWLTLDPKENDSFRFLTYLVSACHSASPGLGTQSLELINKQANSEDIFLSLLSELREHQDIIHLALDDVHHLTDPVVLEFLHQLVAYAPENLRLYFTAQSKVNLPLATLYANGKAATINETDLALNALETQQWLEHYLDQPLNKDSLARVFELSQGWLMGLNVLAQLYRQRETFDVLGDEMLLVEYFQQNILCRLSGAEQTCLRQLASLDHASGAYINSVFEREDAESVLNQIADSHFLVARQPEKNSWFTIHPLLSKYLTHAEDVTKLRAVYSRACDWLHQQELNVEAVEMAIKSGDKKQATALLQITAEAILEEQDIAQLLLWRQQLPDDVITASPRLIIIFSWTLALAQQLDDAERLMAQMDRLLMLDKSLVNDEVSGQLFAIRAYIARSRGNIDNAIQLCKQAIEKLPKSNHVALAITYFNLSNAFMTLDDLTQARKYNRLSFETARAEGSVHLEMLALHEQARIEQVKGHLTLAQKLLSSALDLSEKLPNKMKAAAYGRVLTYKGYLTWLSNKTEEAEGLLHLGMTVSRKCRDPYIIMSYVLLSNIARQKGQSELAFDFLTDCEAQLQRWAVPGFIFQPWLATMRVNLLIDQEKIEPALANLKSLFALLEHNPYALSPEHYPALRGLAEVFYVRAKSIAGHHKDALNTLDKKLQSGTMNQQGFALIFIYLMRALLRFQLGQEEGAYQDFRQALSMAESENCIMPFIEYSSGMTALYSQLPQQLKTRPFVETILQNIELGEDEGKNQAFAQARSVISQRELSVLKLIAQGMSNQEIAEKLFISLHTVKTHARRINSKLAVKSRTQAIIKAREIGLI